MGGRVLSGRMTCQRFVSSESPSNSSLRTLFCGHSLALVTSTWTLAVAEAPLASVAVNRARYVPGRSYVYVGLSWVDVSAVVPATPKSHR